MSESDKAPKAEPAPEASTESPAEPSGQREGGRPPDVEELGGPKGPEPTRYGDWEKGGRCSDF